MAKPENSVGRGSSDFENSPQEKPSDLQVELGKIDEQIYRNEANENIIERTREWEQLTELRDIIQADIEVSNQAEN